MPDETKNDAPSDPPEKSLADFLSPVIKKVQTRMEGEPEGSVRGQLATAIHYLNSAADEAGKLEK